MFGIDFCILCIFEPVQVSELVALDSLHLFELVYVWSFTGLHSETCFLRIWFQPQRLRWRLEGWRLVAIGTQRLALPGLAMDSLPTPARAPAAVNSAGPAPDATLNFAAALQLLSTYVEGWLCLRGTLVTPPQLQEGTKGYALPCFATGALSMRYRLIEPGTHDVATALSPET